jgi:hypothetical protein
MAVSARSSEAKSESEGKKGGADVAHEVGVE